MPLTKADLTRLRSLQEKKHREASGCFVVEGEKVIGELLAAGFPFAELYATEAWEGRATHRPGPSDATAANSTRRLTGDGSPYPRSSRLAITPVTPTEMARISHFPTPSAVLAVGRIARPALAPGALAHGLTLALDQDALGRQAVRVHTTGPVDVYVKELEDGSRAVGFFNRDSAEQRLEFRRLPQLTGLGPRLRVRDLWRQTDLPDLTNASAEPLRLTLPAHGVVLLKVSPVP